MKVNFFAPINHFGTGILAFNLILAWEKLGNELTLTPPFGNIGFMTEDINRWLSGRHTFSAEDPSVMIFDINFMSQFCGKSRIGFVVFETEGLTKLQMPMLKTLDHIITPTWWSKSILEKYGFKNISIIHEGYAPDLYDASFAGNMDTFTFIHIGKYEERKGTRQLIQCFAKGLEDTESQLILHIHNPFYNYQQELFAVLSDAGFRSLNNGLAWFKGQQKITLSQSPKEFYTLAEMIRWADCAVYPTKGEGWGLPIMESIVSGVPTICGHWTGMTEYISVDYPWDLLLNKFQKETANDNIWFHGEQGEWYVPSDKCLVERMKWAFENARKLRQAQEWKSVVTNMRQHFTWAESAKQLDEALKSF